MNYRTITLNVTVTPSTAEKWARTVADDLELAIAEALEAFKERRKYPRDMGIGLEMDSTAPKVMHA